MKQYITKPSQHCYYGNISNILNYYGQDLTEAKLVLLSGALNCLYEVSNDNLYFRIPNEYCVTGLNRIGFEISYVSDEKTILKSTKYGLPVLLCINTEYLTHNPIFAGTNRKHYIVIISEDKNGFLISDSFIQTIPQSVFQGYIKPEKVIYAIQNQCATGITIIPCSDKKKLDELIRSFLIHYIKQNAFKERCSVLNLLSCYSKEANEKANELLNKSSLTDMAYELKFSGCLARLDYLSELFSTHYNCNHDINELKNKWELVVNKLMKCSMTLNENYFRNIFTEFIPLLIEKEQKLYLRIAKMEGIN